MSAGSRQFVLSRNLGISAAALLVTAAFAQPAPPSATASVAGHVTDAATGAPVAGIEVFYRRADGPPEASRVTTDAEGKFRVDNLAAGRYGFFGVSSFSGYSTPGRLVILADGEEAKDIDFRAARAAVLAGRILDPEKRPIQGATVQARSLGYHNGRPTSGVQRAVTNDLGEYRLANLRPGSYRLMVERKPLPIRKRVSTAAKEEPPPEPTPALARTWYPGAPDYEGAVPVPLAAGEQREGLDITLLRERTVCVRFRAVDSAAGARIRAQVVEDVPGGMSTTAEGLLRSGDEAEVCGLPPGSYHLRAVVQDGNGEQRYAAAPFAVTRQFLRLPDLLLNPLPDLRATLKLEGGGETPSLPAPLLVRASVSDFNTIVLSGGAARVGEPGPFVVPAVRPEELWLGVVPPPGAYLKAATVRSTDALRQPFHALEGELAITLGLDGPTVSGEIVDKEGRPVADALAVLGLDALPLVLAPSDLTVVQADQRGRFTLAGIAPGRYRLLVVAGLLAEWTDPALFRANRLKGELLTLSPNEKRSGQWVLKD